MKFKEKAYIVRDFLRNLDAEPIVLAHSLMDLEKAFKIVVTYPKINLEDYLKMMGLEYED